MPDDNTADIASTLAFFGQLGKGVDDLKTKITSLNEASNAMKKMTDETEKFGQTIQRHTRTTFRGMEEGALNLTRVVGGAGGLALSFIGAAKALDSFAVSALQTRNFAVNTGFSTEAIKNMRVQLSAAGLSANEAAQGIGNIGAKLQEVLALQETSPFYRALQASSPALAEQVRQLMNAGKQQEALNVLQEAYNHGGERFKAWLPTVTGISRAAWEAQAQGMKGLIEPWKINVNEAAKYHRTMTNLGTIFDSTWTDMTYTVLEGVNKLIGGDKGFEKLNSKAHEFADSFKKWINDSVIPEIKRTFQTVQDIINWFEGRQIRGLPGALTPEEFLKRQREDKKDFNIFDWLGEQIFTPAHASTAPEGRGELLVQETEKDSSKMFIEIRDYMQKWDNEREGIGVGANGPGGGSTGGSAGGAAGSSSGDGSGTPSAGSPAGLNDENGKKIDAETMRQAEVLGRAGDVDGIKKLFSQRGYHISGPACGMVATGYVKSAGFKPPTGAAIATSWHKWGEAMKSGDINAQDRPFGSMVATYFHGRYGGTQGQILAPGQIGGHVMTVVPGTWNEKEGTAMFADQYGVRKRKVADMDVRFAGASAVEAVRAARGEQRDKIDKANGSVWDKPTASVNVSVKNAPPGVKTNAEADGAFKTLNLSRTNQLVYN